MPNQAPSLDRKTPFDGPWFGVRLAWVAVWLLLCAGCTWRVRLVSDPGGATITLPSGERVLSPEIVDLRFVPMAAQKHRVVVTSAGYRTIEADLKRQLLKHPFATGGGPRSEIRFQLVKEHGPVGTWTIEEELD